MSVTTNVEQVKINVMTKEQFDAVTKDPTELYMVTDAKVDYNDLDNKPDIPSLTGAVSTIVTNDLTADKALISNASGKVAVSNTTSAELEYVHGVTSDIQTQLDNKQNSLTAGTNIDITNNTISTDATKVILRRL